MTIADAAGVAMEAVAELLSAARSSAVDLAALETDVSACVLWDPFELGHGP